MFLNSLSLRRGVFARVLAVLALAFSLVFSGLAHAAGDAAVPAVRPDSGVAGTGLVKPGVENHGGDHGAEHGGGHETAGPLDAHAGTWLNGVARALTGQSEAPRAQYENGVKHITNPSSIRYDYIAWSFLVMIVMGIMMSLAARKARVRPAGKAQSLANMVEASVEGYREYIVSIMGVDLARKYAPLIMSFFFAILFFNWLGLVPGAVAPTSNPNVPISLAIVAFLCTHFIAIKEVGVVNWLKHFADGPWFLLWLLIPLHIIGELIKPLSLALRLLCNVFGEEMVIVQLAGMAVLAMAATKIPIPFQLPMLFLSVFFGFLQALVFSTLLAIYISTMSTHHDEEGHGHTDHHKVDGHDEMVTVNGTATMA